MATVKIDIDRRQNRPFRIEVLIPGTSMNLCQAAMHAEGTQRDESGGRTMQVVKRDGSIVAFDRSKIVSAIQKANHSVDEEERISQEMIEKITRSIEQRHRSRLLVEDIQDMVEHQLMELDGIYARYFNMQFEGLDVEMDA